MLEILKHIYRPTRFSKRFITINSSVLKNASTATAEDTKKDEEIYAVQDDEDYELALFEKEQQLQRKRNKSGLNIQHQNLVNGKVPYAEPLDDYHLTLKYKRKMFGRYGYQSNVDPATLWPNPDELKKTLEYEKVAYPYTIQEMIRRQSEKIEEENRVIMERQEKIVNNLKKLNAWKKEIEDKSAKKLADLAKAKAKKDALIEEVRKHFGYKIDPKDEKFKEMLLIKEREQKKKLKEERTKLRQEKMMSDLMKKES